MATDIVAVQVESLALEPDAFLPAPASDSHTFRRKIRVLKHYRGSVQFADLHTETTVVQVCASTLAAST
jgi:hypothetical protein